MKIQFFIVSVFLFTSFTFYAQDAPNVSGGQLSANASKAGQLGNTTVNYFTGTPSVSLPLYSYQNANNGLSLNISIDYTPGGVRVLESPTSVGLSWALNATGVITRTVRGMPDDIPTYGYLYASTVPADFRSDGSKYYYDSLDAQPDVFSYSCPGNGSGKFYLGKNGQVAVVPSSKIKIIPTFQTATLFWQTLKSFRIVTEDGLKYDFDITESSVFASADLQSGYLTMPYASAWYLSRIISPFNTDTIKFSYRSSSGIGSFAYPQTAFVNSAGTLTSFNKPTGTNSFTTQEITSIDFPDNTHVNFEYSYDIKNTSSTYAISRIKISDSLFRYGYLLDYDSTYLIPRPGHPGQTIPVLTMLFLKSLTPFTSAEKAKGYRFTYHSPLLPPIGGYQDTIQNKRDHWGFYNDALNGDTIIPKAANYGGGANRNATIYAYASSLWSVYLPQGGHVEYSYNLNDRYPYVTQQNNFQIAPATSSTTISLSQSLSDRHQLTFELDKTVSRQGSAPVSGSGGLVCSVKSTDGSITYGSKTISLYDLFYNGMQQWSFNRANGSYKLETSLSSGSSVTGSFPVNIRWENRADTTLDSITAGGLRVSRILKYGDVEDEPVYQRSFYYKLENGKSSGFLGDIPRYDYPFRNVVNSTATDYTAISSDPVSFMEFAQGNVVGYSRVEVIDGFVGNLGKTVYEFTNLKDVNADYHTPVFPYAPTDTRSWGLGLPKCISIYDSSGNLVKRTVNSYQLDTVIYNSSDFRSLKLGHSSTISGTSIPTTKVFVGQEYFPSGGKAFLSYTLDSLYQSNGSVNASRVDYYYDTAYNLQKTVSSFDRTRGLNLEVRNYYPYNYTIGGAIGKLRDSGILSIPIATEKWITGDATPRLISASMTSYKEISNGMIKPDTLYTFESNKPIPQSTIGTFSASALNRNTTYFKPQSQFVSYNAKGLPLEVKDLSSGQITMALFDYNNYYPIAKVSNAVLSDVAYTSFEADGSGGWTIASSSRDLTASMTGKKSYNLSGGNVSKSSLNSSQNYLLTLWAKSGASVSVNGNSLSTSIATNNGWNLYQLSLTGITSVTISGSGLIDEVRLHPKDANMTTQAFEPIIGAISSADAANNIVYNEYDRLNRLKLVRDIDRNIIKKMEYSDTAMSISTAPVWVGVGGRCSGFNANYDTLYYDSNPFSDSSGYTKAVHSRLECSCPTAVDNPAYKTIDGVCEEGTWAILSSVYKKVLVDGYLQWRWVCSFGYCFSDGSGSTYREETIQTTPCSLTCY